MKNICHKLNIKDFRHVLKLQCVKNQNGSEVYKWILNQHKKYTLIEITYYIYDYMKWLLVIHDIIDPDVLKQISIFHR